MYKQTDQSREEHLQEQVTPPSVPSSLLDQYHTSLAALQDEDGAYGEAYVPYLPAPKESPQPPKIARTPAYTPLAASRPVRTEVSVVQKAILLSTILAIFIVYFAGLHTLAVIATIIATVLAILLFITGNAAGSSFW